MKTRILGLVLTLCLFSPSLPAGPPLADRLPADSLVYVGWAGVGDKLADSQLGQLAQEPGIRQAAQALWKAVLGEISREDRKIAELLDTHGPALMRLPVAVAVTRLETGNRGPDIGVVAIADAKGQRPGIEALLQAIRAHADGDELKETKTDAAHYWTVQDGDVQIAFGFKGELFFFSFGSDALNKLLQAGPDKSLATSPAFQAALKPLDGSDVQLAAYADAATLLKKLLPQEEQVTQAVKALGLDGVTSLAGTIRIVDGLMLTRARLNSPAPHRGLLSLLGGPALREKDLDGVPADADLALAWRISPAATLETIQGIVKQIAGRDEVGEGLAEMQKETGVDAKALLASLGDGLVLSSAASQGGFLTGTVLSAEIKDPDTLKAQVARIEDFMRREFAPRGDDQPQPGGRRRNGFHLLTAKAGPAEIRYVQVVENDIIPVAPAWTIHNGRLYVALFSQALQDTLGRPGDKTAALPSAEAFASLRKRLAPNASIVSYVNLPQLLRRAYPLLMAGWTMAANVLPAEIPVQTLPQWLPTLPALQKHLTPQMNAVSADDGGLLFESIGPLPDPSVLVDLTFVTAIWFVAPISHPVAVVGPGPAAEQRVDRPAGQAGRQETQAQAEMRQLLLALLTYAIDNNSRFPDTLKDEKLAKYLEGDLKEKLDTPPLVYLGKGDGMMNIKEPSKHLLVYRTPPASGSEKGIAGFADGHVRVMPMAQIQELVEAQKKK